MVAQARALGETDGERVIVLHPDQSQNRLLDSGWLVLRVRHDHHWAAFTGEQPSLFWRS